MIRVVKQENLIRNLNKVYEYIHTQEVVETPVLAVVEEDLIEKYELLKSYLDFVDVFYAIKANSDREILKVFKELGSGFEVTSKKEVLELLDLGVSPDRIITSNPIKSREFIELCRDVGIKYLAVDSFYEIEKIKEYFPEALVYVRLDVSNEGSSWPLSKKFGATPHQALEIIKLAKLYNIEIVGFTFHVGSQNTSLSSWEKALTKALDFKKEVKEKLGIDISILNIGGGLPVNYLESEVDHRSFLAGLRKVIENIIGDVKLSGIRIQMEPGRYMVAEAGILVSRVIGKAERYGENWLYLDVGVFNGLMESVGGIKYIFVAEREGAYKEWVVAGPSCDGFDVIQKNVSLPDLKEGDIVYILSAGAYTSVYASNFNGFPIPETILI